MEAVHALHLAPLLGRDAPESVAHGDPLDHEHTVAIEDLALGLDFQVLLLDLDLARLQRTREGAGQSAARGGHDVVERRGLRGEVAGRDAVVVGDLRVHAEGDRLVCRRKVREALRTPETLDGHAGDVRGLGHTA